MASSRVTLVAQVILGRGFAFGTPTQFTEHPDRNLLSLDGGAGSRDALQEAAWYTGLVENESCWRRSMPATYTAIVQQAGEWWIGWVEVVPGVNSQGRTREELLDNLRDALEEALEMNRTDARAAATGAYEEVSLTS